MSALHALRADLSMPASTSRDTLGALSFGPVIVGSQPDHASRILAVGSLRAAHGRWLHVSLVTQQSAEALRLHAEGAPNQWPDAAARVKRSDGHSHAWMFISEHTRGLSIHGPIAALSALQAASAQLADLPPPDAHLCMPMRTSATLHRLGVHTVQEVEFDDDADWPLRARGADPQLRFRRLDRGRHRVHLALAIEDGFSAAPVLYWADDRRGFAPETCVACAPAREQGLAWSSGSSEFTAVLPTLREGARLRLDPLARPGRFRLDDVRIQQIGTETRRVWHWLARVHDRLHALQPTRGLPDLIPGNDLRALAQSQSQYLAVGHDPQLRLKAPLMAGWYMMELALDLPAARARARIYLDTGTGESEANAWSLPVRSGKLAKRLLWIKAPSRLRLDPMASPGEFEITHFRLQRISMGFARGRMLVKLSSARGGTRANETAPHSIDALWTAYCSLFEPRHESVLSYDEWIATIEQPGLLSRDQQAAQIACWSWKPLFSVITPTYNTRPTLLKECLDSVLAQTYPHWELCIADDASTDPQVHRILESYAARDCRVRLAYREDNGHIARASNTAVGLAQGDFLALLDHDDTLAPHALFAFTESLQQRPSAQVVYSDEDKLDAEGRRCDPFFKPDYAPDLLRSQNYVSHLTAYRHDLVRSVGGFRPGFEGSQDYDLLLRCLARVTDLADVLHVPQVLYHWRKTEGSAAEGHHHKPYAVEAARRALQEQADTATLGVHVEALTPGLYRQRWPIPQPEPLVSLIIPTRDGIEVLRTCIESIMQRTTYVNYEILVVDNQSTCRETIAYLTALSEGSALRPVRVLRYDHPFNYAAINNFAAAQARGTVLGLINNDVEVINPEWLTEMVIHSMRPEIGCVGAKLYYPDDTVQHAGVVLGIGGVAGHSHKYFPRDADGYFSRLRIVHNVSAVTGAVLLVRKAIFEGVGGLDAEHLHVAFNDVDFCLKVRAAGYLNLWTPFAELYHHESKTRGPEGTAEKRHRFTNECQVMLNRWGSELRKDPFYNPNLSLTREDYSITSTSRAARDL